MSLYVAGSSVKAVAGELGLKVQHVSRLVEERGVKRSRREVARLTASGPGASPPSEWPAELAAEPISLPAASIEVTPGASIETMAGQIARSIMASLRPGMGAGSFEAAALSGPRAPGTPGLSQPGEGNHA